MNRSAIGAALTSPDLLTPAEWLDIIARVERAGCDSNALETFTVYPRRNVPCGPGYPVRSNIYPHLEVAFSSRDDAWFYAQMRRDITLLVAHVRAMEKLATLLLREVTPS